MSEEQWHAKEFQQFIIFIFSEIWFWNGLIFYSVLYWNTMILVWNETFYSFHCKCIYLFCSFGIKKIQVKIHKKVLLSRLWRCKFLLQKNAYPAKLLGFVSWIVMLGFFKIEKAQIICTVILWKYKTIIKATEASSSHTYLFIPTHRITLLALLAWVKRWEK